MKKVLMALAAAAITLTSCCKTNCDFVRYHDDGRQKPVVAIVPMIDQAKVNFPWDVRQEITKGVIERLRYSGQVYVIPDSEMPQDPISSLNPAALARIFAGNQFVVAMELLSHKEIPYVPHQIYPIYSKSGDVETVLSLTMRLQVIDLRDTSPKVILQEVIQSNHMVLEGEALKDINYKEFTWGTQGYKKTPVAIAHMRLEKDIAKQVEDYILSRKWLDGKG